jgi:hypothetical protein
MSEDMTRELIEKYQKAIKELIETCDSYRNASEHCAEIFSDTIKLNYISKDKIREKLNYFENSFDYDDDGTSYELVMEVLEELLEENDE